MCINTKISLENYTVTIEICILNIIYTFWMLKFTFLKKNVHKCVYIYTETFDRINFYQKFKYKI